MEGTALVAKLPADLEQLECELMSIEEDAISMLSSLVCTTIYIITYIPTQYLQRTLCESNFTLLICFAMRDVRRKIKSG